jgi:hypothetical protein
VKRPLASVNVIATSFAAGVDDAHDRPHHGASLRIDD